MVITIKQFSTHRISTRRFLIACAILICAGCLVSVHGSDLSAGENESDVGALEFFEKKVRPLLIEHCYECHAGTETDGGLSIDSREGLRKGGDTGKVIVPGKPEESLLVEAIGYKNGDLQMPPNGKLADADIQTLTDWIQSGAIDPRVQDSQTTSQAPTGMSVEDGRKFWSMKPVSDPAIPSGFTETDANWIKTPIDAFILAKLVEQGLKPAPPADKRTLIRRITLDLIGLPPTQSEVDAFLADESPEAYEKLIERLLASKQYGVRWGRHWLDVARYADSNGLDENLAFGNAWRYRDYVVNAFNNDKPFDRFLVEQIAGDLLPDANLETRTATGFLVLGAKVLAEADKEKLLMDTIDEQLDTTGKAFLGMTIGCVRCHDHKFDPIKQTDYYALAAIFKSTETFGETKTGVIYHWNEHSFASEEELVKLKEINAEIAKKNSAASGFKNSETAKLRNEARANAAKYLAAAIQFSPTESLARVSEIAVPLNLHPRILHHCRLHLEYHRDDPLFARWNELSSLGDATGIEDHYRELFVQAEAAMAEAKKADAKATVIADETLQAAFAALHDSSGFLAVPPKPEFAFDEKTLTEYYRLMEEARVLESNAPDESSVMSVADGEVLTSLPVSIRGSHRNLGDPVSREFPEVMRFSSVRPILPDKQSGRLQFARWMASTQHPLTARVYVNRIWRWHFGEGIVRTTENFGQLGDRPSHPELLDWLAREFMQSGWSTKEMHRLMLRSNVYQMASQYDPESVADTTLAASIDPENRLLWKFHIQRLEAEQLRDSILAVSDRLDQTLGGKTIPLRNRQFVFNHTSEDHTKYDSLRRAMYLPVIRNNVYSFFAQFDFPDPTMPTGDRNATTVAPQALILMNSDLVMDSADALVRNTLQSSTDDRQRIEWLYNQALCRSPIDQEINRAIEFIDLATQTHVSAGNPSGNAGEDDAEIRAWSLFCQSLLASNEFAYVR